MVEKTPNLGLNKPAGTDYVDINVLNQNMDVLDTEVPKKLDKKGAVVEYSADPKQMQVRNSQIANAKPADSVGKDGDMVFIPGSSTIDPSILDGKLDKAGGTMTGDLTVGSSSIKTNGYIEGTWLKTSQASKNGDVPDRIAVLVNGWIYYVTKAQLTEALGVNGKQDKGDYALKSDISAVYKAKGSCTTAELAGKTKETGDVWNLTDAGQYGPIGTNVLWTGTEWDALSGIVDLSSYAKKTDIPDISGKADSSTVDAIAPTVEFTDSNRTLKVTVNGKSDTAVIPGGDVSGKLDKSGGAMTGYLSDKTALQVRNVMTATEKPADTVGQDGDVCVIPGASGGNDPGTNSGSVKPPLVVSSRFHGNSPSSIEEIKRSLSVYEITSSGTTLLLDKDYEIIPSRVEDMLPQSDFGSTNYIPFIVKKGDSYAPVLFKYDKMGVE